MIQFWDRYENKLKSEKVFGERLVKTLYGKNALSAPLQKILTSRRWPSVLAGHYYSSSWSKGGIRPFIAKYQIPIEDFESREYSSFNDFFIRKFRDGVRNFPTEPGTLGAPAEARYFAFENASDINQFEIKGYHWDLEEFLGNVSFPLSEFKSKSWGPTLVARLCPVDYHRFHFPDEGQLKEFRALEGRFHSVNPVAMKSVDRVLAQNERHVSFLQTNNFGTTAFVEVGALCVGKIVQNALATKQSFKRGDEKGYFLFGGSTVVIIGEKNAWQPAKDLIENTRKRVETYVKLGDSVGTATPTDR